jgi:hypothetical protein
MSWIVWKGHKTCRRRPNWDEEMGITPAKQSSQADQKESENV